MKKNNDVDDSPVRSMPGTAAHLLEWAWTLIANAWHGKWDDAGPEWQLAAESWRDAYHKMNSMTEINDDVTPADRLLLVRDFVAERLRVTGDEADTLPVKVAFREYRNWCYDRSLREDETLPFTGVMKALGSMGITRTERPQASPDYDEWSGFALTGVRLHD